MPDAADCPTCTEAGGLCKEHEEAARAKFRACVVQAVGDVLEAMVAHVPHGPAAVANAALAHARAWGCEDRIERAVRQSCALSGELLSDLTDGLPRA